MALKANFFYQRVLTAAILSLTFTGLAAAQEMESYDRSKSLAPYVPTPMKVVYKMLELARVTKDDVVYDLGCGDGRIVVTAAKKYGARGVGVDINPIRVAEAKDRAKQAGVEHLVKILLQDAMVTDLSDATVVMLYLLTESNKKLKPRLEQQLKPGTRVISHEFNMEGWKAKKIVTVKDSANIQHTLYLWVMGEQK